MIGFSYFGDVSCGICSDSSCSVCTCPCTFVCKFSSVTTVKAARLVDDNDAPDPAEVDNAGEFLNVATSLKEDSTVDTKEAYSTLEAEGKLTVRCDGVSVGMDRLISQ